MRFVIALLLAAAMPLQGWAAATLAMCSPAHSLVSGAASMTQRGLAAESMNAAHAAHHHAEGSPTEGSTIPVGDVAAKAKCSVCSACCAASALPSQPTRLASLELAEVFAVQAAIDAPVFLTSGLERPPRPFLA